nr:PREDICTED: formin-like protein 5 isoform X1 [Equus przewalskii]
MEEHFANLQGLKGTQTFRTTTTKPARSRPAPRLWSPPSCHLPPPGPRPACAPLPCPRGQAESGPHPSANFSRSQRSASRDPGPGCGRHRAAGRERPPRKTFGRRPCPGVKGGGGGPHGLLSGTPAPAGSPERPGPRGGAVA